MGTGNSGGTYRENESRVKDNNCMNNCTGWSGTLLYGIEGTQL